MVGDGGVGKTSLYNRFINNEFQTVGMTIGHDFGTKHIVVD